MRTVDIHSHFIPEEWLNLLRKEEAIEGVLLSRSSDGKESILVKRQIKGPKTEQRIPIVPKQYDADEILKDMDEKGIDIRVLSPMQFLFYYWTNPPRGEELARMVNNAVHHLVKKNPQRLIPIGILPMQDVDRSIREMERIVKELGMGAVEIGTNISGVELDDRKLSDFYKKAQKLDVLIFVHPYDVIGMERMGEYFLRNLAGNPFETSLAISRIIFGGVLDEYPRLKLLFSHGGGAAPYIIGRMDHGFFCKDECKRNIKRPPSFYMKSLYFDTITFEGRALRFLLDMMGSEKILLGSDYPFDMMEFDPPAFLKTIDQLTLEDESKIRSENALRLLRL